MHMSDLPIYGDWPAAGLVDSQPVRLVPPLSSNSAGLR